MLQMTIAAHAAPESSSFDAVADACRKHFADVIAGGAALFTTDAADLWDLYLDFFEDPLERQHHNCNCCRQFIQRFGSLVAIDGKGTLRPAIWNAALVSGPFRDSFAAMERKVRRSKVTGVFLSNEPVWGTPLAGGWTHFSVTPPAARRYADRLLTPGQAMAAKVQDFGTLSHGLADYSRDVVTQAVTLLEADALYRSQKVLGPARFLLDLHDAIAGAKGERRRNLIWRAVASAPPGFATPRSSMVGTLLDDIASGKSFEAVKRSFAAKMHPLQYQRPSARPSAGNIEQAERVVERLGIANSLKRRIARVEELKLVWTPQADAPADKPGSVFGNLMAERSAAPMSATEQVITWVKFAATVLPGARKIEAKLGGNQNFGAITTAADPDAPPILQWDTEGERNPFSWYLWINGTTPTQWRLPSSGWIEATGVALRPSMWSGEEMHSHHGKGALIALKGARETRNPGLALFPECLKTDLHAIRSTIEAFSKRGELAGLDEGSACGLLVGDSMPTVLRVTTAIGRMTYSIDRWD